MNRVQFQPGLALLTFLQRYGNEMACHAMALPMSRVLHAAQRLAMHQLLAEHQLVDAEANYSDGSIAQFPSMLLIRCQQDLRRNFAAS
jgi:hypothetical protein